MALIQLARERWPSYFDAISKAARAQTVTVEVAGLALGDHIAAERAAFEGVTYEPRDDMLTLFVQGLEHRIHHPTAIHVDQNLDMLLSMEVIDGEGNHHIAQFSPVLELPSPPP